MSKESYHHPVIDHLPALVHTALNVIDRLSGYAKVCASVQLYTGARAIEVLSLIHRDVSPDGFIFIKARKGSTDRVCYCPAILELKCNRPERQLELIFRKYTYKKYHTTLNCVTGVNFPKTSKRYLKSNLFRRASALISHNISNQNLKVSAEFMGHRSTNSTKIYLNER